MSQDALQTIWAFIPKTSCPLKYADLLVYSYHAKR